MNFTVFSLVGFFSTLIATALVRRFALARHIVDDPAASARKIHQRPVPLLGGVAVYLGFAVTVIVALLSGIFPSEAILSKHLIGLLLGGLWLVIGGILDDIYNLKPRWQILGPLLAVMTVIVSGIGIESISNPAGGQWFLDQLDITVLWWQGLPYKITLLADLFTLIWLLAMIYAVKFFDGLDGLASGITVIGSIVILFTSLLPQINQPDTALLAMIVAACFAGFLAFNWHPATIFLGEGGSVLAGFLVGSLAIISEGKVVTTLVIMALPLLDLIWVTLRRVLIDKKSPVQGDDSHIHHRLLKMGFSHQRAVLLLLSWAVILGLIAFFFQGRNQWLALGLVMVAMVALIIGRIKPKV